MPTKKNGQRYYTKDQYRIAREIGALEYALSKGYELKRDGRDFRMKEHDSMIFTRNGWWFWNARGLRGKALAFMLHYEKKSLVDAVLELAGEGGSAPAQVTPPPPPKRPKFAPPPKAPHARRLYAYLCNTRGLSRETVTAMIRAGCLYEGIVKRHGKEHHNAIFPYYDDKGVMVGAFQRGLHSDIPYKCDIPGSNKHYGWLLRGCGGGKVLYVFEAAIDAASQWDLSRLNGCADDEADRLALCGVGDEPLTQYLRLHPQLERVVLLLDRDEAGDAAAQRLKETALRLAPTLTVERKLPPCGKDWNDALLSAEKEAESYVSKERADRIG